MTLDSVLEVSKYENTIPYVVSSAVKSIGVPSYNKQNILWWMRAMINHFVPYIEESNRTFESLLWIAIIRIIHVNTVHALIESLRREQSGVRETSLTAIQYLGCLKFITGEAINVATNFINSRSFCEFPRCLYIFMTRSTDIIRVALGVVPGCVRKSADQVRDKS